MKMTFIRFDMVWYDIIWYDKIRYGMSWYDMIWYDIYDMIYMIWHHVVIYHFISYHMGTSCPGYELSWVRVVLGTSCLGYELSWVRVVLGTSCLRYELSWVRVVLGTSCLGYDLSRFRAKQRLSFTNECICFANECVCFANVCVCFAVANLHINYQFMCGGNLKTRTTNQSQQPYQRPRLGQNVPWIQVEPAQDCLWRHSTWWYSCRQLKPPDQSLPPLLHTVNRRLRKHELQFKSIRKPTCDCKNSYCASKSFVARSKFVARSDTLLSRNKCLHS